MPSGPPDSHEFDAELEQLRREFVAGLPGQAAALDAALQLVAAAPAEAAAAIRRLAHRLRGAGGSYGFPELTEAAAAVEEGPVEALEARARKLADLVRETARRGLEPREPGAAEALESAAPDGPAGAAILIVEDDPATCRLLEATLQAPQRDLVVAETGAAADRLVHQREFAIILLDLHLPDGDGRRLLAEWRMGPARTASIFVLSADLGHQIKAECLVAGADAFFDKPIRREVIAAAVQSRLQRLGDSPRPAPAPPAAGPEPPPVPAAVGQQVALVVEDDPFVGAMVRHRLSRAGFAVRHATDGAKGLAASAAERPDLVVLDLNLPELNGFQLLERLRADPATHHVPVLILTASGAEKDLVRAFALGADDYLVKPFSPTELLARVQRLAAGGRGAGSRAP